MSSAPATQHLAVRQLPPAQLAFAAGLHARALSHGFFGRLGGAFLRAYYDTFRTSPHAVALLALRGETPVGALVGTLRPGPHYAWVLRHHGWRLAVLGALALLMRPDELALFARSRIGRYLRRFGRLAASAQEPRSQPPAAVLTHVAVDPEVRGTGAGAALVDAFLAAARMAGCREASLVTLAGEQGAAGFYERLGWTRHEQRLDRDGRAIVAFSHAL